MTFSFGRGSLRALEVLGLRESNTLILREIEKRADVGFAGIGFQALVILFVTFGLVVAGVEGADVVEESTARFPEFSCQGETDLEPVDVSGGDVGAGSLELLHEGFDPLCGVRAWCDVAGGVVRLPGLLRGLIALIQQIH